MRHILRSKRPSLKTELISSLREECVEFGRCLLLHRGCGVVVNGQCDTGRQRILLRRGLSPDEVRRCLLHEMCHIGAPGHGQRFQAKLRRLVERGEVWAAEEIASYRAAPSWNQEMSNLRGSLDDCARLSPRPRFGRVLLWLASDLGLTNRQLLSRAQWLKIAWLNACRASQREILPPMSQPKKKRTGPASPRQREG